MNRTRGLAAAALLVASCAGRSGPESSNTEASPVTSSMPVKGSIQADFQVDAVYTDDKGGLLGTRWIHRVHGMPVTVLHIQSVPQVFLAFNTPPVSDRGEPHTGEHLLLGKGAKGKTLSAEQDMSLVDSTAWTAQTDVCYSWSCAAGKETFYRSVEQYLDALLLPNYSDEEIRREVCHIGPVKDEATGKLSVDEKGTIYQEMVSTYEKRWNVWGEMQTRLWGPNHPLSWDSGGEPSAVRTVTPAQVNAFHDAHYHLGADTEMIVALPDSVPENEFLAKLSAQMAEVDARPAMKSRPKSSAPIPPGRPSPDKSPLIVPYPNANEDDVGMALVMWAPVPLAAQEDRVAAALFLSTLGDGESATLYKLLLDAQTRALDIGAPDMASGLDASKIDLLPYFTFDGLPAAKATPQTLGALVGVIRKEIARVAAPPAGSAELKEFDEKALDKLVEREKSLKRQLNSPPLFGHRNAGGFWLDHLRLLNQDATFARSVTLSPVFAKLRADLAAGGNPWRRIVAQFGLDQAPYVGSSKPSVAEREKRASEHAKRVEGYVADIAKRHGGDAQSALAKFAAEYDAKTAELVDAEKRLPKPHLVADVPLVRDASIRLEPMEAAGVKGFRGVFDNMTFVDASVSLSLDAVPPELYPWLAVLPSFLTESGVVEDGKPLAYDEAARRRAREIYSLTAEYSMRPSRGRHELRISAGGADVDEARRAVDWLELSLRHARLDEDNLPRLRDLVAKAISDTRARLGGAEETWVDDPAAAVRRQRDALYLSTSSIHARLFQLARCEWRLMGAPTGEDAPFVRNELKELAVSFGGPVDAAALAALIDKSIQKWRESDKPAAKRWLVPIATRIKEMVGDMAPTTLAHDLLRITVVAVNDVFARADALAEVRAVRDALLAKPSVRFVLTGSRANTDALAPRLDAFFAGFAETAPPSAWKPSEPVVDRRLVDHEGAGEAPVHYGLVNNAGGAGVFVLSAKAAGLDDLDDDTLTTELACRVFGGSGAHAFFMKTWGAGLAYSNGLSVNPYEGLVRYYAERCPDLVQTMSFVTGLVRDSGALDDPYLAEYAVAGAVAQSRESDEYETRARAEADDRVDGDTPERVARWRRAVLALKDRPGLWAAMKPRIVGATGRALPGVGPKSRDVAGGVYFVIAPEPMLARWEGYVREHDGAAERVRRVYGRDFWILPR